MKVTGRWFVTPKIDVVNSVESIEGGVVFCSVPTTLTFKLEQTEQDKVNIAEALSRPKFLLNMDTGEMTPVDLNELL